MQITRKDLTILAVVSAGISALAAILSIVAVIIGARGPKPAHTAAMPGGTYESIKQLPDWSGVWHAALVKGEGGAGQFRKTDIPLNSKGKAMYAALGKIAFAGGDVPTRENRCISRGFPGDMLENENYFEFVYAPGQVIVISVQGFNRHIYTDGRPHADIIDTFQGDSIGHWEGDTLVVETTSIDEGNEFLYGFPGGKNMKAQERIYRDREDKERLRIDMSLEAPEIMTAPYTYTHQYRTDPSWLMTESDCFQNNRDVVLDGGEHKQTFSLDPSTP